jgi:hypothetical protein
MSLSEVYRLHIRNLFNDFVSKSNHVVSNYSEIVNWWERGRNR